MRVHVLLIDWASAAKTSERLAVGLPKKSWRQEPMLRSNI
jgi:hypothetical protein